MRGPRLFQTLSVAAAIALFAGCANAEVSAISRAPGSTINYHNSQRIASYYSCPATGAIKYMSDFRTQTINVYAGKFAGQPPCGQITSGINGPQGLYVKTSTHDLYVANSEGFNVLVFHR